jgi:hypothetical protein
MSDTEKAAITLQKAQAFKIDADAGLVPPEALRVGREDQLIEDGVYPGLEAALDAYEKIMQEQVDNDDVKPTAGPKPPQPAGPFGNKTNANEGKPNGNGANGGAPPKAPPKKSLPNKKINAPKEKTEASTSDEMAGGGVGGTGGGQSALGFSTAGHGVGRSQKAKRRQRGVNRMVSQLRRQASHIDYDIIDAYDAIDAYDPDEGRDEHGRWGSGGGGGGIVAKLSGNVEKLHFRQGYSEGQKKLQQFGKYHPLHVAGYEAGKKGTPINQAWKELNKDAGFDPNQPREYGKWVAAGGGGGNEHVREEAGHGSPHEYVAIGHGYSPQAKLVNGVIHTNNVYDAARALYENRKVELKQPRQVATLIDHLGQVAKHMIALGGQAPVFNLCNVTVAHSNLFCADTIGIPRVKMPQLDAKQTKEFRQYLKDKGYKIEKTEDLASHLRATQSELNGAKVAHNAEKILNNPGKPVRLIVSKDNYILDGHHRWAAQIGIDAANNRLGDLRMRVSRVNIGIISLLKEAEAFTGGKGHVSASDNAFSTLFEDWDDEGDKESDNESVGVPDQGDGGT